MEEHGLLVPIVEWVLHEACRRHKARAVAEGVETEAQLILLEEAGRNCTH